MRLGVRSGAAKRAPVPDVSLHMPDGQIMTVDPHGRVKKETRQ
jgi:hypothetical protein